MIKKLLKGLSVIMLLALLAGFGLIAMAFYYNEPSDNIPAEGVVFKIQNGESLSGIAVRLEQMGIIRSAFYMKILGKIMSNEISIKSGAYKITPDDSTSDIYHLFISGKQNLIRVTVPEGWTIKRIGKSLDENSVCSYESFLTAAYSAELLKEFSIPGDNFEGFLFPDTYFFPEYYKAENVIRVMAGNFFKKLEKIYPEYGNLTENEIFERIILASIVEKEYRIAEEAPLIASVFYNRLRRNIGLESCATIEYIITDIKNENHPEYITLEDTEINSPYNTYIWAGLPPGPISNPGITSLKAVFFPAETDYFYFVLKDPEAGEHFFSRSLEEHNRAKYFYLK